MSILELQSLIVELLNNFIYITRSNHLLDNQKGGHGHFYENCDTDILSI